MKADAHQPPAGLPEPAAGQPESWPLLRTMLGSALRRARLGQGRTLADVARAAQVSMQYLSEVERGRKEASSEILAAVCGALQLDLPDLLAEVGRELFESRRPAQVIRLGFGPAPQPLRQPGSRPGTGRARGLGSGDPVCLLAA